MAIFNWQQFLEEYSRDLLANRSIRGKVPESVLSSRWMGFDSARPEQLSKREQRIGADLPQSYKEFLAVSNGWRESGGFIYDVFPCENVEWFHENNQDWIDAYVEPSQGEPPLSMSEHCVYGDGQDPCRFRVEFLQSALLISDVGDSAVYLLNPEVKTRSGEWEAWFFANWNPGAVRYRSFLDLMQGERRSIVSLTEQDERRYFPEDGIETLQPKLSGLVEALAEQSQGYIGFEQERASKGRATEDAYTDGIIEALNIAKDQVKSIQAEELPPDEILERLTGLAADLEQKRQAWFRPNSCGVDRHDGWAEGNRQASARIRWFVNQPQN